MTKKVITLISSEINHGMVIVIRSNNDLNSELCNSIMNLDMNLPYHIDVLGTSKTDDIMVDGILLENISYNYDMTTCNIVINN